MVDFRRCVTVGPGETTSAAGGTSDASLAVMRRILPLAVLAVVLSTGQSSASAESGEDKSPGGAFLLSFGGTIGAHVAALALLDGDDLDEASTDQLVGALALASIGPSLGHVYTGEYEHAAVTTAIRAGGLVLMAVGAKDASGHGSEDGLTLIFLGGAAWLGSTIYDWVDAPLSARRANARLVVTPAALPAKHGVAPGLVVAGSF